MEQRSSQLVTEHLGFTPVKFIDDLINSINEIMYRCMSDLELVISGQLGHESGESEKGMAAIESLFENAVDKRLDRFEVFSLKNVFFVPNDVFPILPQYKGLDLMVRTEDEPILDNEIHDLKQQIEAELYFKSECLKRQQHLESQTKFLESHVNELQELVEAAKSKNVYPLSEKIPSLYETFKTYHHKVNTVAERVSDAEILDRISSLESSRLHLNAQILNHLSKVKNVNGTEDGESDKEKGNERSAWDVTGEYRSLMNVGSLQDVSKFSESFSLSTTTL